MRKLLLFLILITACAPAEICSPTYFEFREGECCLDENYNNICDVDEIEEEPVKPVEKVVKPVEPVVPVEEKKEYDLNLAKTQSLDAAKKYFSSNHIGLTPAYTYHSETKNKEIYTLIYKVKYLKNLDEFDTGYLKATYDLDKDEIIIVKFSNELSDLS